MPYKSIEELPSKVKKVLPKAAQKLFMEVFNAAFNKYGEEKAFKIAWAAVKKRFKKKGNRWVARSKDFVSKVIYTYYFVPNNMLVTKSDGEYVYIDYVLTDNQPDLYHDKFSDFALASIANSLSIDNPIKGRIDEDHSLARKLLEQDNMPPSEIEKILNQLDTGIEAIGGKYVNGRLVATLRVKKDLLPLIKQYKGASVEVVVPEDKYVNKTFQQARLVGFVLTNNPVNPRTGIAM